MTDDDGRRQTANNTDDGQRTNRPTDGGQQMTDDRQRMTGCGLLTANNRRWTIDQRTNRPTDQQTDGPTEKWT